MSTAVCAILFTVTCLAGKAAAGGGSYAAGAVTSGFLDDLANWIRESITWLFANSVDFWVRLPSPDLASQPVIGAMRQWLLPITGAVAAGGMIAAGLRMILTRRLNPLLDVGTGLAAIAVAGALGILVPDLLLQAGDAWSGWILQASTGGQFSDRVSDLLTLSSAPSAMVVVLGVVVILLGVVQAALMLFRQAAILVLAAVLPLAAAGATAPATRPWIRKIVAWMLALICYKPAAAAVYATAFTMIGTGKGLQATLMGFVMLALSLAALPVLMRFFTWTTGTVASSGGGQLLGMAAAGAAAMGATRSPGGASAGEHAGYLAANQSAPNPAASGVSASAASTPPGSGPGTGPAETSTSGSPAAAKGTPGNGASASPQAAGSAGTATSAGTTASAGASASTGSVGGAGSSGTAGSAGGAAGAGSGTGSAAGAGYGAGVRGGGAGTAASGAAGPVAAAILAGQALASGARNAADTATEGEKQ